MTVAVHRISITHDDVMCFARASHDVNPLHVDDAYARRTSFGRPVVFGVLGALHAIAHIPERSGCRLEKATIEFQGPLFEDTSYDLSVEGNEKKWKCIVKEGSRSLLRATLVFGDAPPLPHSPPPSVPHQQRLEARHRGPIAAGDAISCEWAPDIEALGDLMARLKLGARGLSPTQVASLLAASYVVGMEVPGMQALFARLALSFTSDDAPRKLTAKVSSFDDRFQMVSLDVDLWGATGELRALVRPSPIEIDGARVAMAIGDLAPNASNRFAGKTAVVIGGGRGIGGAIAVALAKSGLDRVVATYASARAAAERLEALDSKIVAVASSADDPGGALRIYEALGDEREIDLLVLSASPAVLGLSLAGVDTGQRAVNFVARSLSLAVMPLVSLAARLTKTAKLIVVSSAYVEQPPKDFAHYAAAKAAIEAFARSFAADRGLSLLIVRPPRVLTDMTNTAFGTEDTLRAEDVAALIVKKALTADDDVRLLSDFSNAAS